MIQYHKLASFKAEFRKLAEKLKTLAEDIKVAKKNAIELLHLRQIDNQSIVSISGYKHPYLQVYKLHKFACKTLKGKDVNSGIKLIYAYDKKNNTVCFIEIYSTAEQQSESKNKIEQFLNAML